MTNRNFNQGYSTTVTKLSDFLHSFNLITMQEKQKQLQNFKDGIYALQDGFNRIRQEEEPEKLEKLQKELIKLAASIKEAREKGIWHKTYFNVFDFFDCKRNEKIHSNILAWLLNPKESHGLNDRFLRSFFKKVFKGKELPYSNDIYVRREQEQEQGRIDVIVEGKDWFLLIENKTQSKEGQRQTDRYARPYESTGLVDEKYFHAFLTPTGEKPESKSFHPVSYRDIAELLRELPVTGDSSILIRNFIEHIYHDF